MNKIIGLVMLDGILALLAGIMENTGASSANVTRLQTLVTGFKAGETVSTWGNVAAFLDFSWNWISNLVGMLTFSYPMFEGDWMWVKYVFFIPVGIGIVYGFLALMRGTSSS